ncbi:MAG TPA: Wzz/FepE/Etk N-terminal domain-containing protein [Ohtaekwangia sp.]
MDLVVLFRILLRKWPLLVLIPLAAAATAFFLTSGAPDVYRSTAQLTTGFTTNDQITVTNEGNNIRDAGMKFNNLIETMNSELVMSLLSYRLAIHDLTEPVPFRRLGPESPIRLTETDKKDHVTMLKTKLDKMELLSSYNDKERSLMNLIAELGYSNWQLGPNFFISRVKDTDYLKIQFVSEDPMLSAFAVNTLSEEYIRYDGNIKSSRSGQSVSFFENLVTEKKRIMDEKSTLLNSYKTTNNVINYEVEATSRISQITEYEVKRTDAVAKIQALNLSINNVKRQLDNLGGDNTTKSNSSNAKILQIRTKIDELTKIYEEGGSTDADLRKTISDLHYELQIEMDRVSSVESVVGNSKGGLRTELELKKNQYELDLEIAEANLRSINSTLAALNNNVSGIATKEATISVLNGEVENATKEYNEALNRYNTEKNKSLVAGSPIRLVIMGQPNGYPEPSKRMILVAFSGIASFVVCVLVIIGIELVDLRLKNPVQFRKFVRIDLAGSINHINAQKLNLDYLFNHSVKSKELESFKHFLRKLRFEVESTQSRSFLVTSTKDGEGKTFAILCLAYSLSLVKKRILIIDTNFRHNSLSQELLAHNTDLKRLESGVFIRGRIGKGNQAEMSEEDFVHSIISPTKHKGINIIGNSGGDSSPSEIFAGRDFKKMLEQLTLNYDYIFLEGSSLNNFSDTKELVEYVDKVIPVFSASSVVKQVDRESIDYLKSLNGKLMGAVLNKVEMKELKV